MGNYLGHYYNTPSVSMYTVNLMHVSCDCDIIVMNKNMQVLEETMRVYMPIPQLRRCLAKDEKVGEYNVPQGSIVYVSVFLKLMTIDVDY